MDSYQTIIVSSSRNNGITGLRGIPVRVRAGIPRGRNAGTLQYIAVVYASHSACTANTWYRTEFICLGFVIYVNVNANFIRNKKKSRIVVPQKSNPNFKF